LLLNYFWRIIIGIINPSLLNKAVYAETENFFRKEN